LHVSVTANPYARKHNKAGESGARKSYAHRRRPYSVTSDASGSIEEPRVAAKVAKTNVPSASVRSLQLRMKATGGQLKRVSDKILRKAKRTY
jgi:BRCT domain type II-containing protein